MAEPNLGHARAQSFGHPAGRWRRKWKQERPSEEQARSESGSEAEVEAGGTRWRDKSLFPLPSSSALLQPLPMNTSIVSWLVLAISTISIFSDVAGASAPARCPGIDQRSLLLELRDSLVFNASESSKLVRWDRSADSWSGVTCKDGLVVGLNLSSESISGGINGSSSLFGLEFDGQIPAELSRLTKLRTLDLSVLYCSGLDLLFLEKPSLRSLIGDLGELRELYLDGVNVSTEGSGWCDDLSSSVPKLEVLSMSGCSLSGPIDASLTSLANLSVIQLDSNNLSATVPSFLANFSSLKTLSLRDCGLQGEFPPEIFQVRTLQNLDVSLNELLRGSLPIFPENSSLQTMVLSDTNISGRLPDSIGNLRNLSRIELVGCSFDGNIPSSLTNLLRLSYLVLSFNNFTGSIPSLSKAKKLTLIILSDNSLTGPIDSTEWESLSSLLSLDLTFNLLEGNIPSSLFTHPSIQELRLSDNRFSSQLKGFFNAPSHMLKSLDLSDNNIGGELPASIWELRGLEYLFLSSNNFSGSFHINLVQQIRNLSYLDLSYNRFSIDATNTASQASSFPDLQDLNLASCQLTTLPQFLANQSKLFFLDLSHNYIKGNIPRWIWTLENLMLLNISSNFFEDLETPLGNLTLSLTFVDLHSNMLRGNMLPLPSSAYFLDFSSNNITYVILDNIDDYLSNTIFFSLSKNNFHGPIPKSICKAGILEVLDLSHNHLNGTIPDCLMMASLTVLNLRNNQLSGDIPQNISATCSLKTLDISENFLQGQITLSMANCATLEIVNIGDNQIDGTFPCHFNAMSSLRVLVLRSNKLHGEIGCTHSPCTWQMLQIIDLSFNNFSGTLPVSLLASWEAMKANVDFNHLQYEIHVRGGIYYEDTMSVTFKGLKLELVKILTIFTSIDFSGNRLEGPIPDMLGDLKALYFLNLSHNAISGSIPPVLGNLDQLESLDLSWNYLNGNIPAQLENLDFLSFLNLSNNQLVGSIPTRGQFLTFSKSSFEGNLGLCGLQLNKSCSTTTNGTEEVGSVSTQCNTDDDGNNDDIKRKWFYMGIPFGFVVGFWVFCGPIVFIRSWRFAYYRLWDKVLFGHSRS
ncbi:receptor-like protein 7 [Syzygium oleosum]|uniref:receptor-like protein 7 n=1 Tax=Syzygium oleosum TaxID=219896 RepID=UPI0024BAA85C|nr:receptor-like protein 7 [Syzygium oleosum]